MLRLAQAAGTTDIVATPHANPEYQFDPDRISEEIERLAQAAGPAPRIHRGCDFHLAYDNVQDAIAHPSKYTINHGCYLLVEFSDLLILQNIGEVFDRLLEAGMVPVITHPERNWLLQQRGEQLRSWVERGCLLQVTAASLLGRFGRRAKRFSDLLLQAGLVHFIASDAHDPEDRTPDMRGAYAPLVEVTAPLAGGADDVGPPRAPKSLREPSVRVHWKCERAFVDAGAAGAHPRRGGEPGC